MRAVLHRKNSLLYCTLNGAQVGDLFMSLIYTCQLCGVNSFDYLIELQRHAQVPAALVVAKIVVGVRRSLCGCSGPVDREYLDRQSFAFDFHILRTIAFKVMRSEGVHRRDKKAERSLRSSPPKVDHRYTETSSPACGPSRKLSKCSQRRRGLGRFPWY
jgi:hypothetical protein